MSNVIAFPIVARSKPDIRALPTDWQHHDPDTMTPDDLICEAAFHVAQLRAVEDRNIGQRVALHWWEEELVARLSQHRRTA